MAIQPATHHFLARPATGPGADPANQGDIEIYWGWKRKWIGWEKYEKWRERMEKDGKGWKRMGTEWKLNIM